MQMALSLFRVYRKGGKSGQHRAACFLTGRHLVIRVTESATENKLPRATGEKVKT